MQLKTYQIQALEQLARWVGAIRDASHELEGVKEFYKGQGKSAPNILLNYPLTAWDKLKEQGLLPSVQQPNGPPSIPDYIVRTSDSGDPIPHVCLKIPTGGGKTLIGVAALEHVQQETGLVLWVMPNRAIYEQTIKALRAREHPYRQMLERIACGRVKLLEKDNRFTRHDVSNYLCVMMLMLPAANRRKNKDFLKIFRDSGSYDSFFPEQDDIHANKDFLTKHPDLEQNDKNEWMKHSLINTLKIIRPTVILDEAHKAYGTNDEKNDEFVKSINRLNPSFVLELSATPKINISNILVDIGGLELQQEEMIKLPIEIHSFNNTDWKHTLTQTQEKLSQLANVAHQLREQTSRYIRPIALVRVERTGSDQRASGYIHAEDVREYLIQNLAIPAAQIRVQTSEQKELAGEDLLSDRSQVRWIVTKDALKEGWDCPFAYVLALLDNTKAETALTQMIGRVMRQPQALVVEGHTALNRCYVYCYNTDVGKVVQSVKDGLEKEGLTGLGEFIDGNNGGENQGEIKQTIARREKYKKLKIFLPRVLHKNGKKWRPLDYDSDILGGIAWDKLRAEAVSLGADTPDAEIVATVDIHGESKIDQEPSDMNEPLTLDYFVRRLVDVVPNPWQAARIVDEFLQQYKEKKDVTLLRQRIYLSEALNKQIKKQIDIDAENLFKQKVKNDEIRFHLETDEKLNYAVAESFEMAILETDRNLQGTHGKEIQRSLFQPIYDRGFNGLEKDFALYLDSNEAIHWWHRIAARQEYALQGWRRDRVCPDFIACQQGKDKLLILETKGMHLAGNEDTKYKKNLLDSLEHTYRTAVDRGMMKIKEPPPTTFHVLFEDNWKESMHELVDADD